MTISCGLCVFCVVVVLTGFVMCGYFGKMCTCIYYVLYCLYCVFVLFRLCIFFVLSVLVQGLQPPNENSIAVSK